MSLPILSHHMYIDTSHSFSPALSASGKSKAVRENCPTLNIKLLTFNHVAFFPHFSKCCSLRLLMFSTSKNAKKTINNMPPCQFLLICNLNLLEFKSASSF